jgi:hypothetical protein
MAYKQPSAGLPFKQLGSSPAKEGEDKVVDGVLCDAYGNPKPSAEQIKNGTKSPDFSK